MKSSSTNQKKKTPLPSNLDSLERKVWDFIQKNKLLSSGEVVLAAVSGGADSICLLRILKNLETFLGIRVEAITVNHGIRGATAQRDVAFVQEQCAKWKVPLHICQVNVPEVVRREGLSEEEAARKVRYNCFFQTAHAIGANKVAVAHHRDDNCETILHHLFRGSSLRGLGGMAPAREMRKAHLTAEQLVEQAVEQKVEQVVKREVEQAVTIIRPLLSLSRTEVERWLSEQAIDWCTDETNLEDRYTRNRLRHQVIPLIERELNPQASEHVVQAAGYLAEAQELIEDLAKQWMKEMEASESVSRDLFETPGKNGRCRTTERRYALPISELKKCRSIIRREILFQACGRVKQQATLKNIGHVHLAELEQLMDGETSKWTLLPGNIRVTKQYEQLIFCGPALTKSETERGIKSETESGTKLETGNRIEKVNGADSLLLSDGKVISISQPGLEKGIFLRIFSYNGEKIPENSYTKWFDYDKIKNGLSLRTRQPGDYFQLENGGRKTLKSYLIDQKIPVVQRDQIPLLAEGAHIVWIGDGRISAAYKVSRDTHNVLEIIQKRGE